MLSFLFLLLVRCTRKPWVFALGQHKKTVGNGPKLSPRSSGFVATSYPFCAEKVHSFAFYNTKVNQYWQNAERIAEVCKRNSRKYSQSGAHPPRRGGTLKKSKSKGESKGGDALDQPLVTAAGVWCCQCGWHRAPGARGVRCSL